MRRVAWIILCFAWLDLNAQQPAKKTLSSEDFGNWNTLSGTLISNDGNVVTFLQTPQQGDGMLVVNHGGQNSDTIPRGNNVRIGPENNFVIFEIKPTEEQVKSAKRSKVKREDMPGDTLGILLLDPSRRVIKFPHIKSYSVPDENAEWIAFSLKPKAAEKDSLSKDSQNKKKGDNLVLFQVSTADTITIRDVSDWVFSKKGATVWFRRELKDSAGTYSSVYVFDTNLQEVKQVFSRKGWIERMVTDEQGKQCAFLFSGDSIPEKKYSLYAVNTDYIPEKIADEFTPGIPIGWSPGKNGNLYFSQDGNRLFFGTAVSPAPEPKDSLLDEEQPRVDIWSWHDEKLMSQQLVEATSERRRTYLAVYDFIHERVVQLADPSIKEVFTIQRGNGNIALGYNEQPYIRETGWTGDYSRDYYIIDLNSGDKREIADCKSYVRISPQGNYVIWYDNSDRGFYARSTDIRRMEAVPLTQMIPVNFFNEDDDRPSDPLPYGIAGWSEDDRFVYIYDRYDIWRIDPAGERVPVCITRAFGRRNLTRLRYLRLDTDMDHIPSRDEIILSAFDERTMSGGFFSTRINAVTDPQHLVMGNYHYSGVRKAKNADKLIWSRETVSEFPDMWISDINFSNAIKISDANPQQVNYVWPEVQMVEWTSFSGEKLKGLLYLPENLNVLQKNPMLVYFYERNSENLHRHQHPSPSQSIINKTFYASNGYVVFVPDITYSSGFPGQSCYNAVLSGTQYLINTYPFIDEKKIGLQGHSWGGYQIAWMITRTDLYAAAMAGAPVSNMTSAYGGIRWQSGLVRMFQYERQQSRIGGSLWEKPFQYIENSPLFSAPQVNTPLLMMHNDNDGAVPWSQGIEFFVALRRLDKPVWMLNYNNEPHNLRASSWANRMDLSTRMFQFFNHYLKGYPQPEWMEKGIPAVEKGKNLGY